MIALALLLLPWVADLIAVNRHHHLDSGTVAAVSIGLATLWVAWATLRGPKRAADSGSGPALGQIADQLATAVGAQWETEAAVRRLNDPYPLPVSWGPADASLTDSWESLARLASSGAGWPAASVETWAAGPGDLAGEGGELAEVLTRVPTGRLVVLGEPGAGKTMLMVRLVLDLLTRRAGGGPVPFLASVASWNPTEQDLRAWLGARLQLDHPALADLPPAAVTEPTQASALLASGLILPLLDGLDEIPEQVRGAAISRINDALRSGEQVVVTCRTEQYLHAVRPPGGTEVTLRAAAAVQLCPLDADTVRSYLRDDAAGPAARTRWDPVLAVLGTAAPAGQALCTPLMVGLARAIYNPRPGELAGTLRDPAELCNPALPDRRAVESLLFDAFIPAAYRHDSGGRWKAPASEKWLVFLARHLEWKIGSPDLAWWQLWRSVAGASFRVVVGAVAGVAFGGLFGVVAGVEFGVVPGAIAGVVAGALVAFGVKAATASSIDIAYGVPVRGMRIRFRGAWATIVLGVALVAVGGALVGTTAGTMAGVVAGFLFALALGVVAGLEAVPGNPAESTSPQPMLVRDRRTALLLMFVFGAVIGAMLGIITRTGIGAEIAVGVGVWGGLAGGLLLGISQAEWPSYLLTVGWLASRHQLPRSLMSFLADAHQRGILRQAGAVYQFRHIELQHRLANRDTDNQRASGGGAE